MSLIKKAGEGFYQKAEDNNPQSRKRLNSAPWQQSTV
jgi:hypothetical protein